MVPFKNSELPWGFQEYSIQLAQRVSIPQKEWAMKTYLEFEEVELLELAASCLRDRLLIRLPSRLGCRLSVALAIRHEYVDFKQETVTIIHLKRTLKLLCPLCKSPLAANHRFCPGCAAKIGYSIKKRQEKRRIRILPVDKDTMEMLKIYICENKLSE